MDERDSYHESSSGRPCQIIPQQRYIGLAHVGRDNFLILYFKHLENPVFAWIYSGEYSSPRGSSNVRVNRFQIGEGALFHEVLKVRQTSAIHRLLDCVQGSSIKPQEENCQLVRSHVFWR